MKIDSNLKPVGTASTSGSRAPTARAAARKEGAGSEVSISATSAQLAGSSSEAPVDGARIAEIKLAITEGRFSVNSEAIAEGLIDTARQLIESQRKA